MQVAHKIQSVALVSIVILLLAACSPQIKKPVADPDIARAAALMANGDYLQAAQIYQGLAQRILTADRNQYLQAAADAYLQARDYDNARRIIAHLEQQALSGEQALLQQLMQVELFQNAVRIPKGHRLRLSVSASDIWMGNAPLYLGRIKIYANSEFQSSLVLPEVPTDEIVFVK